jgi:hypothetical protein
MFISPDRLIKIVFEPAKDIQNVCGGQLLHLTYIHIHFDERFNTWNNEILFMKWVVINEENHKRLDGMRREIPGKYTAKKKESFDNVITRVLASHVEPGKD